MVPNRAILFYYVIRLPFHITDWWMDGDSMTSMRPKAKQVILAHATKKNKC